MKANELMIDDWVKVTDDDTDDSFIGQVKAIDELGNINVPVGEDIAYPYSIDCLEPIPLTPEILEKNGFKECVWFGQNAWSRDYVIFNSVTICIDGRDGGLKHFGYAGYQSMIVIDYVHQLQHALRLCGIDETIEI